MSVGKEPIYEVSVGLMSVDKASLRAVSVGQGHVDKCLQVQLHKMLIRMGPMSEVPVRKVSVCQLSVCKKLEKYCCKLLNSVNVLRPFGFRVISAEAI